MDGWIDEGMALSCIALHGMAILSRFDEKIPQLRFAGAARYLFSWDFWVASAMANLAYAEIPPFHDALDWNQ